MTYASTVEAPARRADVRRQRPPRQITEEDESLREMLRRAGPSNPHSAIAHYLNAERGHFSTSAASAASYFFEDWLQRPANSAAASTPMPLDTAGTLGAPELLERVWTALTHLSEGPEESHPCVTTSERGIERFPGWLDEFRKNLDDISTFGRDWDGHGADPISGEACNYALEFVQALPPSVQRFEPFPEPDGGIGIEYHRDKTFSLYLSFSPEGTLAYVAVFRALDGKEEIHRGDGVKVGNVIPQRIREFLEITA